MTEDVRFPTSLGTSTADEIRLLGERTDVVSDVPMLEVVTNV